MFEFLGLYILGAIAVTLCAGAAPLVLHAVFGPTLPASVQTLSETFTAVFKAGAAVFLGPAQILKRINVSVDPPSTEETPSLPQGETKQITNQNRLSTYRASLDRRDLQIRTIQSFMDLRATLAVRHGSGAIRFAEQGSRAWI